MAESTVGEFDKQGRLVKVKKFKNSFDAWEHYSDLANNEDRIEGHWEILETGL